MYKSRVRQRVEDQIVQESAWTEFERRLLVRWFHRFENAEGRRKKLYAHYIFMKAKVKALQGANARLRHQIEDLQFRVRALDETPSHWEVGPLRLWCEENAVNPDEKAPEVGGDYDASDHRMIVGDQITHQTVYRGRSLWTEAIEFVVAAGGAVLLAYLFWHFWNLFKVPKDMWL